MGASVKGERDEQPTQTANRTFKRTADVEEGREWFAWQQERF